MTDETDPDTRDLSDVPLSEFKRFVDMQLDIHAQALAARSAPPLKDALIPNLPPAEDMVQSGATNCGVMGIYTYQPYPTQIGREIWNPHPIPAHYGQFQQYYEKLNTLTRDDVRRIVFEALEETKVSSPQPVKCMIARTNANTQMLQAVMGPEWFVTHLGGMLTGRQFDIIVFCDMFPGTHIADEHYAHEVDQYRTYCEQRLSREGKMVEI